MNNEGKMEETPEWDLFSTVEQLKAIVPKLRKEAKDAYIIAFIAFKLSFITSASTSDNPRALKDCAVGILEEFVSPETLKALENAMLDTCERIEKIRQRNSK